MRHGFYLLYIGKSRQVIFKYRIITEIFFVLKNNNMYTYIKLYTYFILNMKFKIYSILDIV